jgi:hypothetical protein
MLFRVVDCGVELQEDVMVHRAGDALYVLQASPDPIIHAKRKPLPGTKPLVSQVWSQETGSHMAEHITTDCLLFPGIIDPRVLANFDCFISRRK